MLISIPSWNRRYINQRHSCRICKNTAGIRVPEPAEPSQSIRNRRLRVYEVANKMSPSVDADTLYGVNAKNNQPKTDRESNNTGGVSARARYTPIMLFRNDILLVLKNIAFFPGIVYPFWTANERGELYLLSPQNTFSIAIHAVFAGVGFLGFAVLGSWIFLHSAIWIIILGAYLCVVTLLSSILSKGLQEGKKIKSRVVLNEPTKFTDEKWFFVNGIMTGHLATQNAVDEISRRFQRPVVGIQNNT